MYEELLSMLGGLISSLKIYHPIKISGAKKKEESSDMWGLIDPFCLFQDYLGDKPIHKRKNYKLY